MSRTAVKKFRYLATSLFLFCVVVGTIMAAKYKPHVYPPLCVGCGDCVQVCPKKGKAIYLERGKAIINLEECIGCKKCIYLCSYGAVR